MTLAVQVAKQISFQKVRPLALPTLQVQAQPSLHSTILQIGHRLYLLRKSGCLIRRLQSHSSLQSHNSDVRALNISGTTRLRNRLPYGLKVFQNKALHLALHQFFTIQPSAKTLHLELTAAFHLPFQIPQSGNQCTKPPSQ